MNCLIDSYYTVYGNDSPEAVNAKTLTIPETYKGIPVKVIGEEAFVNYHKVSKTLLLKYNVEFVNIPNSITSISTFAFAETNIKNIKLPDSVEPPCDYFIIVKI